MNLAVIPARGGSKRIPRKNVRPFDGKPILAYSVEAALRSGVVDRLVVSTDDPEIAEIARSFGAETPFVRPPELANDHVHIGAVLRHAVRWAIDAGSPPDFVCCLFATAPFLTPDAIRDGLERLRADPGKLYAFGAAQFSFPIQRAVRIRPDGGVEPFRPECMSMRSQDLEPAYHDAGQFFWGRAEAVLSGTSIFSPRSIPVVIPPFRVQDIDSPEDWERAEYLHRALKLSDEHARGIPS